jgi:hypothetical protein
VTSYFHALAIITPFLSGEMAGTSGFSSFDKVFFSLVVVLNLLPLDTCRSFACQQ